MKKLMTAFALATLAASAGAQVTFAGGTDQLITGVWEGLSSHHTVTCPVCSGKMTPRYGSGARPVGGRCKRCGSTLG